MLQLRNVLIDVTVNFPREHKYTEGDLMRTEAYRGLHEIGSAYINIDIDERIMLLSSFQARIHLINVLASTAAERKWISLKAEAKIIYLTARVGKQATNWRNSLRKAKREQELEGQG